MLKRTNIKQIQEIATDFLYLKPEINPMLPILVMHPFFGDLYVFHGKKRINILEDEVEFAELRKGIEENIWKMNTVYGIISMIRTPYRLTFLKFIKKYLSLDDFSESLGWIYVGSENPNNDKNVSIPTLVRWFKQAKKESLMNEEELKGYNSLLDRFTLYRGVAVGRKWNGISWTIDLDTAKWFANRFNEGKQKGYVLQAEISKKDVLAYFSRRNEKEIVCKPKKEQIQRLENL